MQKRWAQGVLARSFFSALMVLLIALLIPQVGATALDYAGAVGTAQSGEPLGERVGVAATHLSFSDPGRMEQEFQIMAQTGIKWLRTEFAWADMEWIQGAWTFDAWDRIVNKAQQYGIKILGILMSSPPWANGGNWWNYPPTDMNAWRNYVSVVTSRYSGKVAAWEIWNEPNIPQFWAPWPDVTNYTNLLKASSTVIRTTDPGATIVMAGMAGFGADFMDAAFKQGAADYIDAIAYHPYPQTMSQNNPNPQESTSRYLLEVLKGGLAQYTSRPIQIWITEIGWTTSSPQPPGVDPDTQANYMLRGLTNYADTDVDKVFYFSLEDPQPSQASEDNEYGLMKNDLSAKPSLSYFRNFESLLGASTRVASGAVEATSGDPSTLELHSFRLSDGGLVVAAWKSDDGADLLNLTVKDPFLGEPAAVDPLTGATRPVSGIGRDSSGRITVSNLAIGKNPVLLKMGVRTDAPQTAWYFAEGYTGDGFQEYLCLGNSGTAPAGARITFLFPDGGSQEHYVTVGAKSRATVDVNASVGKGREVSAKVLTTDSVVVERPMYFDYEGKWTGGHDVVGANASASRWYFAEGYTGGGFDEWITVLNPGDVQAGLTFHFQTSEGREKVIGGRSVPAHSRATFKVNDLLGPGVQNSLMLESSQPIVAERSMYFLYMGMAANNWPGGDGAMGTSALSKQYLFAEGTTRPGFEEWLTLQNPNPYPISVTASYQLGPGQGDPVEESYEVGASTRMTVFVADEVGYGKDVSVKLTSSSTFLAERPMYFRYTFAGADWTGAHVIAGSSAPSAKWFFAEGYTGEGFHEWISVQNPADTDSYIKLTYYSSDGANQVQEMEVPAHTRTTVMVNDEVGQGKQIAAELQVVSGPSIVAERPMYFNYAGWPGGHDVLGFAPAR